MKIEFGRAILWYAVSALFIILLGTTARPLRAAAQIKTVAGRQETLRVPMVSEPWSATAGRVFVGPQRPIPDFGEYPGAREWKRQANARRKALEQLRAPAGRNVLPSQSQAPVFDATTTGGGVVFDGPGESDTPEIPPDPQIAAGPNHVVVAINSLLAIYDKSGNPQGGFQSLSSFFSSLGISGEIFDPRLIYDQTDQRFILSAGEIDFTNLSNGHVLVAVSATSDPTGAWYKFAINSMGRTLNNTANTFPDFPGLGLTNSALYVTTNQFGLTQGCLTTDTENCYFSDAWIRVINLPELLSGNPALSITTFKRVTTASGGLAFAIQPALTYGSPGAEFLVAADYSSDPNTILNLFAINTSGTRTLTEKDLTVPSFALPPDAAQPNGSPIFTNDFRILNAVWEGGYLWCGHNVQQGPLYRSAGRWYQIQLADLGSASLNQSGAVYGAGDAYYPALSLDAAGTVIMAFTTSSYNQPASAAFAGRDSTDAAGSMRGYALYRAGLGPYNPPLGNRWGDYSGISEDPDGGSVWMIAEYAGTPDPFFRTGIAQVRMPPSFSASPSSVSFGQVQVGSSSNALAIAVSNVGTSAITLNPAAITGLNAKDFTITSDQCSSASLSSGQSCTISVTFSPTINNYESAQVSFSTTGSPGFATVELDGLGIVQAVLDISPQSLSFPPTVLLASSAPQSATLKNTGNVDAHILGISGYPSFLVSSNCPATLSPGTSCQLTVVFHPLQTGLVTGYAVISTDVPGGAPALNFQGTGAAAAQIVLCPPSLDFGNQAVGSNSGVQSIILSNNGSATLTISRVTVNGSFPASDDCSGSLPPAGSCTINVSFAPTAIGVLSGSINVYGDVQGSPKVIPLSGNGVAALASMSPISPQVAKSLFAGMDPQSHLPNANATPKAEQALTRLPLYFESNAGQFNPTVAFIAHARDFRLAVTRTGSMVLSAVGAQDKQAWKSAPAMLASKSGMLDSNQRVQTGGKSANVKMTLVGESPAARVDGLEEQPGKTNYLIGNDPGQWKTDVATFLRVKVSGAYPGIDLIYYGNPQKFEYDFVVAPGGNPGSIRLRFDGARKVQVDGKSGDLMVNSAAGELRFHKPLVYQPGLNDSGPSGPLSSFGQGKRRTTVEGRFALLADNQIGFVLDHYDATRPLIIDPVLAFSTFLGGADNEVADSIAVDSAGNVYVAGYTASADFPVTAGAFQTNCTGTQNPCSPSTNSAGFVSKLKPDGSALIYSTYLGSPYGFSRISAIGVDSSGSVYATGQPGTSGFPTTSGAYVSTCPSSASPPACLPIFVAKLNPTGSGLVYSTYLAPDPNGAGLNGGPPYANTIAIDAAGNAYIGGSEGTGGIATTSNAFQKSVLGQASHAFLTELNPSGSGLVYSTYLSGSSSDQVNGIALDPSGNIYVAGTTQSLDFPTTPGSFMPAGYPFSAFVAKFSPSWDIIFSTYLGGPLSSEGDSLAADSTGVYVSGDAHGGAFPVSPGAYNTDNRGLPTPSQFVAKIHPMGCALIYSTYLPGANPGFAGNHIAVDNKGNAFVVGATQPGVPAPEQVNALEPQLSSGMAVVSEINPQGTALLFSTVLGGSLGTTGNGIAIGNGGDVFVTGITVSPDFPILAGAQPVCSSCNGLASNASPYDAFVSRISPAPASGVSLSRTSLLFPPLPVTLDQREVESVGLMNNQGVPLNISSVAVAGLPFSLQPVGNPCTGSIPPGKGCAVAVQFAPGATGMKTGTITISDDGPGSPRTVALNGLALADFTLGANPTALFKGETTETVAITSSMVPGTTSSGNITLSCSGAGSAVCSFNPPAIPESFGSSMLTLTGIPADAGDTLKFSVVGTLASQTYTLPIAVAFGDFSFTPEETSNTVTAGSTATYTITANSIGSFNNEGIIVTCTGAPNLSTCSVLPSSLTLFSGTPATIKVMVATTGTSVTGPANHEILNPRIGLPYVLAAGCLLLLLTTLVREQSRRRPVRLRFAVAILALTVGFWVSCGGGGGGTGGPPPRVGTSPGTYTITVTGALNTEVGNLSHSVNLTLTVR